MHRALPNYLSILDSKKRPKFKSLDLSEKIAAASRHLECCELCSRGCKVNRAAGERGVCKAGPAMSVSSCFVHHGEEHFLVPSFTIFFHSCTFSCKFCQNWEISQVEAAGTNGAISEAGLARVIDLHGYCRNVNFVGGEPTPYLPFILGTMRYVKSDIPVVWNSNFYMSEKSMDILKGVVDVYLSDFKYGNDECAERLSDAPRYSEIIRRNHRLAFEDSELVIRHLVLPNHVECCTKPVLEFIADNFGDGVVLNLMDQYRPCYRAGDFPDINRRITIGEFEEAVGLASRLGLNFVT